MTCMKSLITGLLSAVALDGVSGVPAAAWQKAFDEPYRPIWMKRVKGYAFVGSHWKGPSGDHGIGDFLSQQGDALKGDRLFFYVQHPTPAKTCCGEKAWGQDDGCSTQALSIYPNAVAISGHCHLSLTDERNVWQGAFTSVGGSALWQVALDSGRENSSGVKDSIMKGRRGDQDGIVTSHVQFVSVYDNHIRIERFDIRNNLPLGEDWVLPLPVTAQTALTDEKRSRLSTPPGPFPSGAEIRQEVLSDRIRLNSRSLRCRGGFSGQGLYCRGLERRRCFWETRLFTGGVWPRGVLCCRKRARTGCGRVLAIVVPRIRQRLL